ncbi:hypothetical protein [Pontibacter rugosus]|uniref:Uncharacterized protein n=1 Tax=Pontibacter rugosus TaxID=1745966 RepID=A0ABW3SLT6_9BACT
MQAIQFNDQGELRTTPQEVISDLCTAPTREEAQDALWAWVQPVLLECHRQQQPARVRSLTAFYEQLEQLVNAVYHMREDPTVAPPQPKGTRHD